MSLTIKDIKEYCIQVDLENVLNGDTSIGVYSGVETPITFTCEKDIRLFYANIGIKTLLEYYSSYNGLEDYKIDDPDDYKNSYSIDFLSLLNEL
jgi:hypothetical protein